MHVFRRMFRQKKIFPRRSVNRLGCLPSLSAHQTPAHQSGFRSCVFCKVLFCLHQCTFVDIVCVVAKRVVSLLTSNPMRCEWQSKLKTLHVKKQWIISICTYAVTKVLLCVIICDCFWNMYLKAYSLKEKYVFGNNFPFVDLEVESRISLVS
jgi:hypothetical protein